MASKIWNIFCETNRIIVAQPGHYLTLSFIFLLPPSFVSLLLNILIKYIQQATYPILTISLVSILFLLISYIFTYCAVISITSSVYPSFLNQPIKLKQAFKSISTSFFPLLATDIIVYAIYFVAFLIFALVIGAVSFVIAYLTGVDLQAHYFFVVVPFVLACILFFMFLGVQLSLVKVIVVVESLWGLEPLRRSWKLVEGMLLVIIPIFTLFGLSNLVLASLAGDSWILILVFTPIVALLTLYNIAVLAVLYVYCKDKNEKLADQVFATEKDEARLPLISS
ncbi:uncharacterized protein LOC131605425 [Vicia villosa]|uniref:uncharacterized protein LOC131605425 n=1 Tax=Vicia villosa TaxID=3911 RepID=UPI00273C425C|nr:uncharacterized protein LOC131605425 [Vicia villosa]